MTEEFEGTCLNCGSNMCVVSTIPFADDGDCYWRCLSCGANSTGTICEDPLNPFKGALKAKRWKQE